MGKFIDLTGQRFGRLIVIERVGSAYHGEALWQCECDCGTISLVTSGRLRSGNTKSCGCFRRQATKQQFITHGYTRTPTYSSWLSMLKRCNNSKEKSYASYGGSGISVCKEWENSFEAFLKDVGERPEGTTLDRIDSGGNYEPGNCRWATIEEQNNNRRNVIKLTYSGETNTVAYFSSKYGIAPKTIKRRLALGWSVEDAITRPVQKELSAS